MEIGMNVPAALRRIVITGNGGSGKTWLAKLLAEAFGITPVHLDDVYWEPGRYGVARDKDLAFADVRAVTDGDAWLIEGVYGLYVNIALRHATSLIWLDLSEEECIANIRQRGIQGGESVEAFEDLVKWVSEYKARKNNWNSFDGHLKLYDGFSGIKIRLTSREEIAACAQDMLRT